MEIPSTENIEEIIDHNYQIINFDCIFYFLYVIVLMIATTFISLNQKKFSTRYKIDNIFFFVGLYITNFVITWYNFTSIQQYIRVGISCILFFFIAWFFNRFQIIGLTGGIAMGKSTVSSFFKNRLRISIIDCDELSRRIYHKGKPAYIKVVNKFGKSILDENQEIDRTKLGEIVFNNKKLLTWLSKTAGWYIFLEIVKEVYNLCIKKKENIVILDAPLLFESKYLEYFCYPICCVYISDEQKQLKRLMERNNISEEEAMKKIKSQMPIHKKIQKSDIQLSNDGTVEQLINEISRALPKFVI